MTAMMRIFRMSQNYIDKAKIEREPEKLANKTKNSYRK